MASPDKIQKLRFNVLSALGLFIALASASWGEIKAPANVDEALTILFKEDALLSVLGGIKPIATFLCPFCRPETRKLVALPPQAIRKEDHQRYLEEAKASYRYIEKLAASGSLRNSEVEFVPLTLDGGKDFATAAINKSAIERLLQDKEAMAVIKEFLGTEPKSVPEAVALFKKAAEVGGFRRTGPVWANAVVGTMLGFPPQDVRLYSREPQLGGPLVHVRLPHPEDGTGFGPSDPEVRLGSFVSLSPEGAERKRRLYESGKSLLNQFKKMRSEGISPSEIFNHPEKLRENPPVSGCLRRMISSLLSLDQAL